MMWWARGTLAAMDLDYIQWGSGYSFSIPRREALEQLIHGLLRPMYRLPLYRTQRGSDNAVRMARRPIRRGGSGRQRVQPGELERASQRVVPVSLGGVAHWRSPNSVNGGFLNGKN